MLARALLVALLLLAGAARAETGTTTTSTSPWWARIVSAPLPEQPARFAVDVGGEGGGGRWTWRGEAHVRDGAVELRGDGSATVRVVLDEGRAALEVQGVGGVRIAWRGELRRLSP